MEKVEKPIFANIFKKAGIEEKSKEKGVDRMAKMLATRAFNKTGKIINGYFVRLEKTKTEKAGFQERRRNRKRISRK